MASISDIAKMQYTLENPDSIILAGKTSAYVYMQNGKNRASDTVLYERNIGAKPYYAVQAVADTKAKTLHIVTAFIGESGNKNGTPQFTNEKNLGATSETAAVDVPNGTIAQPGAEVKGKSLNSSRTETDSSGNILTEAQQKYFENSQVRDEEGNLKVVYHGSPAIFTEFSADFMSSHGSSEGQGFYFTDYKPMAEGYQKSGGQLLEGYLNIQKPLSDSEVTLKRSEVKKLLQALDPTGDDLVLNYDSMGGMGYPSRAWYTRAVNDTLNAVMTNESDSEIDHITINDNLGTDVEDDCIALAY